MNHIFDVQQLSLKNSLFVFALESEAAAEYTQYNKLICGIGKVNAAFELTRAIQKQKPQMIINLGSAGSNYFKRGEVVCCKSFIQRDMDVRGLGYSLYETPFSDLPVILNYGLKLDHLNEGICGSGDNFEMNHQATVYNVVDMEAFALAYVAMKEDIPFLCLKYISDGADGAAADDWAVQVHRAAIAFKKVLFPGER